MATNFSKKLYTNMIKKREETEMKNSIWNLKNALTSTNPHIVKPYKASMCFGIFFSDHCIKKTDSLLPWVCSVIDHRRRQNVQLVCHFFVFTTF